MVKNKKISWKLQKQWVFSGPVNTFICWDWTMAYFFGKWQKGASSHIHILLGHLVRNEQHFKTLFVKIFWKFNSQYWFWKLPRYLADMHPLVFYPYKQISSTFEFFSVCKSLVNYNRMSLNHILHFWVSSPPLNTSLPTPEFWRTFVGPAYFFVCSNSVPAVADQSCAAVVLLTKHGSGNHVLKLKFRFDFRQLKLNWTDLKLKWSTSLLKPSILYVAVPKCWLLFVMLVETLLKM